MKFNEDSRVKIPTILHLMRLGYEYLSLKDPKVTWDHSTNIFTDIFLQSVKRINPGLSDLEAKQSPEFAKNKSPDTPTNRICTSLFQRERLAFVLRFAFAYVKTKGGLQKHVMRYPQMFATKAIEQKLEEGVNKGIIWHTQGSGKTALAYYNVKYLSDYFQKKGVVAKFYFIVDRLDLLIQASREFTSRGLLVHTIDSRDAFAKDIKQTSAIHNNSGKAEITVVNIQKFKDDPAVTKNSDYNLNVQRVFFLDEVHRSYNPKGSFLANL